MNENFKVYTQDFRIKKIKHRSKKITLLYSISIFTGVYTFISRITNNISYNSLVVKINIISVDSGQQWWGTTSAATKAENQSINFSISQALIISFVLFMHARPGPRQSF